MTAKDFKRGISESTQEIQMAKFKKKKFSADKPDPKDENDDLPEIEATEDEKKAIAEATGSAEETESESKLDPKPDPTEDPMDKSATKKLTDRLYFFMPLLGLKDKPVYLVEKNNLIEKIFYLLKRSC